MLSHALRIMKKRKIEIAEGYPTKPGKNGRYIAEFSWTGTQSMFKNEGFTVAGNPHGSKQRVRKVFSQKKQKTAKQHARQMLKKYIKKTVK